MLYYARIHLNEGIDVNKIGDYWFFNHGFKFQNSVCNDCHDLTMLCL